MSVFLCSAIGLFFLYLLTFCSVFAAEYLRTILANAGFYRPPTDGIIRILGAYFINFLFTDVKDAMVNWVNHGKSRRYRHSEV